jgi:altronate dehydratase
MFMLRSAFARRRKSKDFDYMTSPDPIESPAGDSMTGWMLILADADNVGVVVSHAAAGSVLRASTGASVEAVDEVPRAHKIALADIPRAAVVRKYGEAIGVTTRFVRRGEHVHVHNTESQRLRGDLAREWPAHWGAHDDE